jgi:hypothetical protein
MICCKIKGKSNLTVREKKELSGLFRNYFMSYNLDYVFLCDSSTSGNNRKAL